MCIYFIVSVLLQILLARKLHKGPGDRKFDTRTICVRFLESIWTDTRTKIMQYEKTLLGKCKKSSYLLLLLEESRARTRHCVILTNPGGMRGFRCFCIQRELFLSVSWLALHNTTVQAASFVYIVTTVCISHSQRFFRRRQVPVSSEDEIMRCT